MDFLVKNLIKLKFIFSSKASVKKRLYQVFDEYLFLKNSVEVESLNKKVRVSKINGIDEDMREWSFNMLIEHNLKVSRSISEIVRQLSLDEELHGFSLIDPKKDVMPNYNDYTNVFEEFEEIVTTHIQLLDELNKLRGTKKFNHPIFGKLDAHMWNCMFVFHLEVHLKQANSIIKSIQNQ